MLGGDKADVTLVKVVDPATVTDANNAAPAGARWVGLEITTVDHSSDAAGNRFSWTGWERMASHSPQMPSFRVSPMR